jgi:hypothetical protein
MGNPASKSPRQGGERPAPRFDVSIADVRASELRSSGSSYLLMLYVKLKLADGSKRLIREHLIHRFYDVCGHGLFVRRDSDDNFFVTRTGTQDEIALRLHTYEKIWASEDGTTVSAMITVESE